MSEKNRAKEYYINNKESIREDPKIKDYQKEYRKTMTDEKKQKMKEYQKEYQKEYRKTMTEEQKQRYKEARNKDITDKESNNEKIIVIIIKDNDHFNDVIKL